MKSLRNLVFLFCLIFFYSAKANIKLPNLFQSNMVLQRDKFCTIWGWADKNENVSLQFNNQSYKTKPGTNGKWKIILPVQPSGGPFTITITGNNTITLNNILFGDVWVCGGQSNMQFHVSELAQKEADSVKDNNSNIRIFTAGLATDYVPHDTLSSGEWEVASVETIQGFSAVAFFFGRYLQEKLHVPIGLISDNLGATSVETWMSNEAIHQFPQFNNYYNTYLASKKSMKQFTDEFEKMKPDWEKKYYFKNDPGLEQQWYKPETDTSDWKTITLPGYWEDNGLAAYDGSIWFRRTFDLPANYNGKDLQVALGQVDDYNIAWVNGYKIGEGFGNLNYNNYNVSDFILKAKNNVLVVRVFDAGNKGGMYNMFWNWNWAGNWKYKPGVKIDASKFVKPTVANANLFGSPSILYNGCIAPLTQLSIKGAIWYQGESNAGRAEEYKKLFPAFIKDWRKQFNQGDFPFLFVQLANYYQEAIMPEQSEWAELREAQTLALALPNTGMAVAIDIGEAYDIHPKNKMDVGKRLGIAALKAAYNRDTVNLSPIYDHTQINNDTIVIFFKNTFDTLITKDKYEYVRGFSIAGNDSVFHWAKAFVRKNTVLVYSDEVKNPVAVRYAWASNPGALDLYNKEGLPAAPFRTDNWKGITAGRKFEGIE